MGQLVVELSSKHISFLLQRGEPRNSSYLRALFSKATPILSFYHLHHSAQQKIKMKIAIYSALFCLILGNQVFARPQVNLVIDTGDSVTEVVRPEDKRRLLNEFQPISILRQSLPKFQEQENVFHVEVESTVLYLTKPKDRDAKRREKAEKRTQVPRQ